MRNKNSQKIMLAILAVIVLFVAIGAGAIYSIFGGGAVYDNDTPDYSDENPDDYAGSLDRLLDGDKIKYQKATPVKAPVQMDTNLYDELPDIDYYPLAVEGGGDIDIEIMTSGEKAGAKTDGWLIEAAEKYNAQRHTAPSGETISISIRSVPSGTGADYVISGKHVPVLYSPSNELFGEYAIEQGADMVLYQARTVGNTAGILVKKGSGYASAQAIIDLVISGSYNLGYTNPQTSATGINLLLELLNSFGDGDVRSQKAADVFAQFNDNIPYIAYTTQQMRDSAAGGSLDGMVSEYQAYVNDPGLTAEYDFIAFGQRHDNPLYLCRPEFLRDDDETAALQDVYSFLMSSDMQAIATRYGFNQNDEYQSSYACQPGDVAQALSTYKKQKDAGRDIIAVFVADCSGSMDGEAMNQLKSSMSNGIQYINENNLIGLVSYSDDITIEVPIAPFDLTQKSYFQGALNRLMASGSTYTYEALCVAMKMIREAQADRPDAKCMIFLLSDGQANGKITLGQVTPAVIECQIPVYTIGYTAAADMKSLGELSSVNEAASISSDTDDIVYKIRSLFNAQL